MTGCFDEVIETKSQPISDSFGTQECKLPEGYCYKCTLDFDAPLLKTCKYAFHWSCPGSEPVRYNRLLVTRWHESGKKTYKEERKLAEVIGECE